MTPRIAARSLRSFSVGGGVTVWLSRRLFFCFWNVRPAFEWGHLHGRKHGDDVICNMLTCACKNYLESAPHHNFSFWLSVCHNILGNNASLKRMLHCFHMGSISLSDTILVQKPWRRHSPCHCGAEKTSTSFAAKVGQQIYSSRLSFQSWRVTQNAVKNSRYSKLR